MKKVIRDPEYSTVLDLDHVSSLIRFLYENEEAMAFELRNIVPTYEKMKRTMEELKENGLVSIDYVETPRITYKYRLTEKGKKIGEKLVEIDQFIRSS